MKWIHKPVISWFQWGVLLLAFWLHWTTIPLFILLVVGMIIGQVYIDKYYHEPLPRS